MRALPFRVSILVFSALSLSAGNAPLPGDASMRAYLKRQAELLEQDFLNEIKTRDDFEARRAAWRQEYFEMLGLWPLPEKTPLQATVTGTLEQPGFKVEKLHFQSRPGLYVTANLYLPSPLPNEKLPAIVYQCGHSNMKRDGNKSAYQDQGIWFATHGYVCIVLDTLQLGEIAGIHHGTYREGRWWWHSAGYTPAGVECWNAIRAIDYLQSRAEVDPERIGATGISGGGAATFWIAAADERIKAAAPCAAMADLTYYTGEDGVNGHCDCMFLYNRARWNWTHIAALICPRPLLFTNSDADPIFPMSANERVINRLERLYARFGVSDKVDAVVSVGGHAYRQDLRRAIFEFFNRTLKQDGRPVTDPDSALVEPDGPRTTSSTRKLRIEPERLRVFPTDDDFPKDRINARVDETFVARVVPALPQDGGFDAWRTQLLEKLKHHCFNAWPSDASLNAFSIQLAKGPQNGSEETEPGITVHWRWQPVDNSDGQALIVLNPGEALEVPAWAKELAGKQSVLLLQTRGMGPGTWTVKNPPNTVERSLALLGSTVDSGRVWDIVAVLRRQPDRKWTLVGDGAAANLAVYAALFSPNVESLTLTGLRTTHAASESGSAPALLNVLRVCDVPDAVGALAPRKVTLRETPTAALERAIKIYESAKVPKNLQILPGP